MGWRAAFTVGIAALAFAAPAQAATWNVTATGDQTSGCSGTTFNCPSLRAAIAASEATKDEPDTINVIAGTHNLGSDLVIQSEMTIVGAGGRATIIDGNGKGRGFRITASGQAAISNVTIRNGIAGGGDSNDGGGILNLGFLGLTDVRVTSSEASGRGGGVANQLGYIVMDNVLVDNNLAGSGGGGINNVAGAEIPDIEGWLNMTDTTIFNNTSGRAGVGGLNSTGTGAVIALTRMTIADNDATTSGVGGIHVSGNAQATASIIARNLVSGVIVNCEPDARPTDGGFNVEDDKDCNLSPGGLTTGLATSLRNEGGQVDVLPISASSPAKDRLPKANATCTGSDQRSLSRPQGEACDAGAYEFDEAATVTITEGPTGTITTADTEFRFQASEPGVTVECDLVGPGQTTGFEECYKSNVQPYSGLADGPYTFSVRAVSASFPSPPVTTRSFVVNAAGAPNTDITGGPSGLTNDNTPTFNFVSSEAGSTFECRVGTTGGFTACTSPHTTVPLADGARVFQVRAIDAAGVPDPSPASRSLTVDATAPNTTIGSGPSDPHRDTTATFTYTSSEANSTFECSFDTGGYGPCLLNYTGLSQAEHTFRVRAIDQAGNVDQTPDTRTFTVDTIAPDTTIDTGPNGPTGDSTPTFTFTSNEANVTYRCRIGAAQFADCATPFTPALLADGTYVLTVIATDAAGNPDNTPATRTFTVDTNPPPAPSITGGPTGPTNDTTPTFTFTGEAGATLQCRIDTGIFADCVSGYTPTVTAQTAHTFEVRAIDAAGNLSTVASRSFSTDTTVPAAPSITGGPNGPTNDTTPTFTFTGEAGATLQCRIDTGTFTDCVSGYTPTVTAQTAHTFEVQARDAAGNLSTVASRSFSTDTTAPAAPTITGGPNGPTNDTTPTFTFTGEAGATLQCRIDTGTFTDCVSGYTPTVTAQTAHTFEVQARDAAGNLSTVASRSFSTDTTPPAAPSITGGPNGPTNDTTPTFTFTGEAGATLQCRIDTGAFTDCVSGYTPTVTAQTAHTFEVQARDAAGNLSAVASRGFSIDTTAPAAPVITAPTQNALLMANTINVQGTAEPNTTVQLTEGAASAGSSPVSGTGTWNVVLGAVSDGSHTYVARTIDAAGNQSTTISRTVTVDTVLPNTTIVDGPEGLTNDPTPTWTFSSSEMGSTFECSLDGAAHTGCSNPFTASTLSAGPHTLSVRAVDPAGNRDNTPATRSITVDTSVPSAPSITSAPNTPGRNPTPAFAFSTPETGMTFQCRVDTAAFTGCTSPHTTAPLADGPHTFAVRAVNTAGTPGGAATFSFTVDTGIPAAPVIQQPTAGQVLVASAVTVSGTAEAGSSIDVREGQVSRGTATTTAGGAWTLTVAVVTDGTHTYTVTARDAAGNTSAGADRTFRVDTVLPSATIATGPAGPTNDTTPTFTFTSDDPGATFECRIGAAAFATCPASFTPPALPEGTYTLEARAVDSAGNRGAGATRAFTVDTTQPAATVTDGPAGTTTETSPAFAFSATEPKVECRLDGPSGPGAFSECASPKSFNALAPGEYVFVVRATDAAGNQTTSQRAFTVTQPQAAQPTPTPSATPTPTPPAQPTPVPNETIVVAPAAGTVLVKIKGQKTFEPLDVTKGIPNGSEVDVRKGRVTLTSIPKAGAPPETATFYDGMFIVTQKGGITDLKLSEKLDGCKPSKKSGKKASLAAAKKKTRRLWGNGKGAFRTTGQYSAATVRGTIWLVQDTCTTTLTRVTQGVVQVNDFVTKKKILVKKGKRYTAKAKK